MSIKFKTCATQLFWPITHNSDLLYGTSHLLLFCYTLLLCAASFLSMSRFIVSSPVSFRSLQRESTALRIFSFLVLVSI